jgi:hypothetical protein
LRATALAVLLYAEVLNFSQILEGKLAEDDDTMAQDPIEPPAIVSARQNDLYLLGKAGGHLLQMISALNVSNEQLKRLSALYADQNEYNAIVMGIRDNFQIALRGSRDAVHGLANIIRRA